VSIWLMESNTHTHTQRGRQNNIHKSDLLVHFNIETIRHLIVLQQQHQQHGITSNTNTHTHTRTHTHTHCMWPHSPQTSLTPHLLSSTIQKLTVLLYFSLLSILLENWHWRTGTKRARHFPPDVWWSTNNRKAWLSFSFAPTFCWSHPRSQNTWT